MRRFHTHFGWLVAIFVATALAAAGPIPSAALKPLGADRWHQLGHRGQGVKVAVLDTGFRGYRHYLGKSLPRHIAVQSFRTDRDMEAKDSQHGIYCAEIIHAIAPDAELMFASWQPEDPETFVAAIAWARSQGAKIISCSVIMPCWSDGEGGGDVHAALRKIIGPGRADGDLLAVACAGNVADRHWCGGFKGQPGGLHLWPNGSTDNIVTAWGDELVSIEMCRPTQCGYLLTVLNSQGKEVGRVAANADDERRALVVRFAPKRAERYTVRVQHNYGIPGPFHLTVLGGALEQHTKKGSIPFPGDGPEWLTIGAWENDRRADYSSCGPNSPSAKPDLVASVPFPGISRSKPFGGTSAASPQAAGLAALYWSRFPAATAADVRLILCQSAEDLLRPGHDTETGHGLLRLP